jgi:hypothetical protein
MGRQVGFYMLGKDEQEFLDFALSDPQVVMLGEPCFEKAPRILKELPTSFSDTLNPWSIHFWNRHFPFETTFTQIQKGQAKGMYGFSSLDALVIEFTRCLVRKEGEETPYIAATFDPTCVEGTYALEWGRIWAEMYRLEGDQLVYKGDEFAKWYERLARWIRRRYKRVGSRYLGPRAYQWHQSGGRLSEDI